MKKSSRKQRKIKTTLMNTSHKGAFGKCKFLRKVEYEKGFKISK